MPHGVDFESLELLSWTGAFTYPPQNYSVTDTEFYAGNGIDWFMMADMWPALFFGVFFYIGRGAFKTFLFPRLARMAGIRGKRANKLGYQLWLLIFYVVSSIYGYIVIGDREWVAFPLGKSEMYNLFVNSPFRADSNIQFYYAYAIGFYLAELMAIFVEPERSDFFEYLLHHVVTLYLVAFSWMGYETRIGTYVLLIHDISDIGLCTTKIAHYIGSEMLVNVNFVFFLASFIFMRLVCLPSLTIGIYYLGPLVRPISTNCFYLGFFVGIVLQALHIFWFYLILRMLYRLVTGGKGDVRSDEDELEEIEKKSTTTNANAKPTNSSKALKKD